jgi:hypothetical protein
MSGNKRRSLSHRPLLVGGGGKSSHARWPMETFHLATPRCYPSDSFGVVFWLGLLAKRMDVASSRQGPWGQ